MSLNFLLIFFFDFKDPAFGGVFSKIFFAIISSTAKSNLIIKARRGLKFLGAELRPSGRRLSERSQARIALRLNLRNTSSYHGVISKHGGEKMKKWLNWRVHDLLD